MSIEYPGRSKHYAGQQQNSLDDFEFGTDVYMATGLLKLSESPATVLDVGSGVGRGVVHMAAMWPDAAFWLYDGEGEKQVAGVSLELRDDTFYSNAEATEAFMVANGVKQFTVLQNKRSKFAVDWSSISREGVQFDLVTSFRAVGFHWPMGPMLDRLEPYVKPGTKLLFESKTLSVERVAYSSPGKALRGFELAFFDLKAIAVKPNMRLLSFEQVVVGRWLRSYIIAEWR